MSDSPDLNAPEFHIACDLRWSDFDRLGHLNQAVYHVLLEQVRTAWLNHVRPAGLERHEAFVLARVELDYRREVDYHHEQVTATNQVTRIGSSSVTCTQEIRWLGTLPVNANGKVDRVKLKLAFPVEPAA